jgi:hypothetical protein
MKRFFAIVCMSAVAATSAMGATKAPSSQIVDAGSFGVFLNGKRIATETFKIEQRSDFSIARSELKVQDGDVAQQSEMQLDSRGDILHYSWHQLQPVKSELSVEPTDEFLTEKVGAGTGPNEKAYNVPHLLPHSTPILDDNFFLHREILLWRYLAAGCTPKAQGLSCALSSQQFGVLVPAQHVSEAVTIDFKGPQKIQFKGRELQVSSFLMKTDGSEWTLYLDDQDKLVRIVAPAEKVEVTRD